MRRQNPRRQGPRRLRRLQPQRALTSRHPHVTLTAWPAEVMKPLFVCVVWVLTAGSAAAQERVLGLLSLPKVFGARSCAPFEPGEVALHAAPNDGKALAFIRVDQNWSFAPHGGCEGLEVSIHRGEHHEDLPTLEYDYEMPGAIVLDQRDGWFKI